MLCEMFELLELDKYKRIKSLCMIFIFQNLTVKNIF